VIRAGPAAAPVAPLRSSTDPGFSAVRDVTLGPGVPDLAKGRRPVVPPLARLGGVRGKVEVRFAVDAAGTSSVSATEGPDLLKDAAREAVASWVFRRTSAERVRLVAEIDYGADNANASVRREEQP
jgi:outer membrane biosynthesis protein TonB